MRRYIFMSENPYPYATTNPYGNSPSYYYPPASPAYYPVRSQNYYPAASPANYPAYTPGMAQPNQPQGAASDVPGMLPMEESYIENILRLNKGKLVTVYMTFENNTQANSKVFKGTIEAAGRDHLIPKDPQTGKRYLLLMIYLNYVTFDEE